MNTSFFLTKPVLILSMLIITLCSCSANTDNNNNGDQNALRLRFYSIDDSQMVIPAFRVLAPAGYNISGGLTWNATIANLVTANVSITATDKPLEFYVHPAPMYISGNIEYQWGQGQLYLGMIVHPMPNSPTEFIQQLVLPQQRPSATNIRLVKETNLDKWASSVAQLHAQPGSSIQGYGVSARFAYTENGKNWEEDFYCAVIVQPQMQVQNYIWLPDRNLSVRAPAGKLDDYEAIAKTFVNSFRVEKNWFGRHMKIQQEWIQAQQRGINNAGRLSQIISQVNDHFTQTMTQSWKNRQQAEDYISREFSEYMRDSEHYSDPINEQNLELPGGYQDVWTNVNQEYILSNEAGYDPNRSSNIEWKKIQKIR